MPTRRRGFTLIELLVVIGIMLVLIGLLWAGWSKIHGQAGSNSARATMEIAGGAFGTYKANTNLQRQPTAMWQSPMTVGTVMPVAMTPPPPQNITYYGDFWNTLVVAPSPTYLSPNNAIETSDGGRNTGIAWLMIASVPENASALQKLPTDTNHVVVTQWSATSTYTAGQRVWWSDTGEAPSAPRFFEATTNIGVNQPPQSANIPLAANSGWKEIVSTLNDPWGNPILFVPSHGLYFVQDKGPATWNSTTTYQPGTRVIYGVGAGNSGPFYIYTCLQAVTSTPPPKPGAKGNSDPGFLSWGGVCSPDFKPFWASAGPDGDFSNGSGNGDDNVYSFSH